ncbi:Flp pilus assembly complex ATPase component TadA [Pseudomonas sp. 21LCFQ02]|uniref:ATPase, T2SS/T4P/T4SS family n=1 Tax=Pseudomonas sp. 21LCFQ02 TaxID=2957505 RepID=UPI00209AC42D|nr:ATPase, T2SS/T4P/T4SS family [Pseudomonas sp. 21LCFQ02]MCO8166176.1 Flp pilus assembly complex ATPase component TadA [Pseudomonas sp. 21LCFQ02]
MATLTLGHILSKESRTKPVAVTTGQDEYSTALQLHTALGTKNLTPFAHIVGSQHTPNLCPFQLDEGRLGWVILATADYVESDICSACRGELARRGANDVRVLTVTPTLLLNVSEGGISGLDVNAIPEKEMTAYRASFQELVEWALINKASDIHLNVSTKATQSQIQFTIGGKYVAPPRWKMPTARLSALLSVVWQWGNSGKGAVFSKASAQQCQLELVCFGRPVTARWASITAMQGPAVTLRILDSSQSVTQMSLEQMGYLPSQIAMLERAMRAAGGATVIAGEMGSGKSTLFGKLLELLGRFRKVMAVEEPVEYLIPNVLQISISNSLTEDDSKEYTAARRTIRRSAPNDVGLGEIRDLQTGDAMQDLANSGTSLYTTIHAQSAWQTPERLYSKSIGVPSSLLASPGLLKLLVYQALVPRLCPDCAIPLSSLAETGGVDETGKHRDAQHWQAYIERIIRIYEGIDTRTINVRCQEGCASCQNKEIPDLNGYNGREVIAEMIEPSLDHQVLRCIMNQDTIGLQEHLESLPRTAINDADMTNKTILECAMYKALQGKVDPRDIEARTSSFEVVERLQQAVKARRGKP